MTRNLKLLGLALAAVFAMSAVSASSAMALKEFKSEKATTTLTGAQEGQDVFLTEAGKVKCTTADYSATQSSASSTTINAVGPVYGGCSALAENFPATVEPNGCTYRFHITGEAGGNATGTVDIICTTGEITVRVENSTGTVKCIIHIPTQTGIGPITYTNAGTAGTTTSEVTVDVNVPAGITYTLTAGTGTGACSSNGSTTTNGGYTGKALFTGEEDGGAGAHVGIKVE